MTSIIPITLKGENLGQRHQYLNNLVQESFDKKDDFKVIKEAEEFSPIDRLFKIDLANKLEDVEYIVQNLKNDDLLYVSRALKSKWLIKHENIINPEYLENSLYPEMLTTAITKMRHWLYINNLKDEKRCQQFYNYYKEEDFEYSMKFFYNTPKAFILEEFSKIIEKITPNHFEILCEKCSDVAKIFFDSIQTNSRLKSLYCSKEKQYFECLKRLLRYNSDLYLDLIEKYQNMDSAYNRSPNTTKYILRNHKDKVMKKPELYTYCILDIKTLAEMLNEEEIKNLVKALAGAKYLRNWFNFKNVEPLIKRLNVKDRALFKKKIFVEKDIDEIENWPYEIPKPPQREENKPNIFNDYQNEPRFYETIRNSKRKIKKKSAKWRNCDYILEMGKTKTLLDKLFDEYRFSSFEKTLYELRKRIAAESSNQNREFMMLVLISKSGGRSDAIAALMDVFMKHINEPANVRAAVIRSLVKRAFIWRSPEEIWNKIMEFGHGLGLNGKESEAECIEGFHAVLIRNLLQDEAINPFIFKEYLTKFTYFSEYSLTSIEKKQISIKLPKILLSMAKESDDIEDALNFILKLVSTLQHYKIKVATYLDFINTINNLIEKDYETCKYLLKTLFESKIARKDLFRYTFNLIQTDASYINALKYDVGLIDFKNMVQSYKDDCLKPERFMRKLSIYFGEDNGLAKQCVEELKIQEHNKIFGRSLAILLRKEFDDFLDKVDASIEYPSRQLSAQLRANAHFVRPAFDITKRDWNSLGAKVLTNKYIICRKTDIENVFDKFIHWKRTMKLAFKLPSRVNNQIVALEEIANRSSNCAIRIGLKIIKKNGDNFKYKVWEILKPLIVRLDLTKKNKGYLLIYLKEVDKIPSVIRPDYCVILYQICKNARNKINPNVSLNAIQSMPYLCHIEMLIKDVEDNFLKNELLEFLEEFKVENVFKNCSAIFNYENTRCYLLYVRILIKFLLMCKTEEIQKERLETLGKPFLEKIKLLKESDNTKGIVKDHILEEMLLTLKYTNAFINPNYVSCIPVLENIVKWLHEILPLEKNLKQFVYLHLTMLYCKTLRQSVKNYPEIFFNEDRKVAEGTKIVGNIFGKYIAKEVSELTEKYFETVIELYRDKLKPYLDTYFNEESVEFISAIVNGILEGSKGPEYRLGIYLLSDVSFKIPGEYTNISKVIKEKDEQQIKFFAYAELY